MVGKDGRSGSLCTPSQSSAPYLELISLADLRDLARGVRRRIHRGILPIAQIATAVQVGLQVVTAQQKLLQ
jgi:hypothetical protein